MGSPVFPWKIYNHTCPAIFVVSKLSTWHQNPNQKTTNPKFRTTSADLTTIFQQLFFFCEYNNKVNIIKIQRNLTENFQLPITKSRNSKRRRFWYVYLGEKAIICEFIIAINVIFLDDPLVHPEDVPFRPIHRFLVRRFHQLPKNLSPSIKLRNKIPYG